MKSQNLKKSVRRVAKTTSFEKSAILGWYRCGANWGEISALAGIGVIYAKNIVRAALSRKSGLETILEK